MPPVFWSIMPPRRAAASRFILSLIREMAVLDALNARRVMPGVSPLLFAVLLLLGTEEIFMMNQILKSFFAHALLTVCCCGVVFTQNKAAQIPKEVSDRVGTYTGSWTSYGLDENGQVVKQAAWTDTIKARNPVAEKNRVFVTTTDEMTFEGGRIPPMKVPGREGYALNSDGSLGEYFIETYGQTYKFQKLSENVRAYTVSATPQELARFG